MQASDEVASLDEDSSESLGNRLRQAREDQDLSLDAVSAELRIEAPMLQALEEERFDALGAPVFAKGFLKQYGARLGLDTAELVAQYESASGEVRIDIAPSRSIRLRDDRQVTFWVIAGLALVVVAATLAVWWWLGSDAADQLISDSAVPVTIEPDRGPGIDSQALEPVAAQAVETPAIADPATVDSTALDDEPEEPAIEDEPEPPVAAEAASPSPQSGPQLLIVFNEDSWTEVSDEAGERLFYGLGLAGSSELIPADSSLNLFFGNAAGVELSLGGEPVEIPASARRGDLAQFDFDPEAGRGQ